MILLCVTSAHGMSYDERHGALDSDSINSVEPFVQHTLTGHQGGIGSVAISPDNSFIVTGSWDNTAKVWTRAVPK